MNSKYPIITFNIFIALCLLDACLTFVDSSFLFLSRVLCTSILLVFYVVSVTRINYIFVATLVFFVIADGAFCLSKTSILGFIAIIIARVLLLMLVLKESWKIDKKLFVVSSTLLSVFAVFIFTLFDAKNIQFYLAMIIAVILVVLFSVLFNKLIISKERGIEELFLAITIFIITDVIFSMNDMSFLGKFRYIIVLGAYHLSYYLLCAGMIKKASSN